MPWVLLAIGCCNVASKTVSDQSESLKSHCFSPLFYRIYKIVPGLLLSKFLWIIANGRQPDAKGIKRMDLVVLFQVLEGSNKSKGSATKAMEHNKMRQVIFRMWVGINLMDMVLLVDFDIPGVELMFEDEIGEGECLFVDFESFLGGDEFVLDEEGLVELGGG